MPDTFLPGYVGRERELAALQAMLVGIRSDGMGRFVLVRGRRRVGKSWLIEEFIGRHRLPGVFFTATHGAPEQNLARYADALTVSTLPMAARSGDVRFLTWEAALVASSTDADRTSPSVIVLDEFPYICDGDPLRALMVESMVSAAWERTLARRPVLLIVVGSDLAMMEQLTSYGRPLYDRPTRQLVVDPLTPGAVGRIAGLSPARALDAYAVGGGLPAFARSWRGVTDIRAFLLDALSGPDTTFVHSGARMLDAEFPAEVQARTVLTAIGSGERTASTIGARTGIPSSNLDRSLKVLVGKRVVRQDQPLAGAPLRAPRYTVADPYLRFWLRFVLPAMPEIERLRTAVVADRIVASWEAYRGQAIEPIVRDCLTLLLPHDRLPGAAVVGSWWTRASDAQLDLVGADHATWPLKVAFAGSIKWRERRPFDTDDSHELTATASRVPGVTPETPLVAVSRAGVHPSVRTLAVHLGPAHLLAGDTIA